MSHPSLVVYFFSNPTHKTEMGTANRWELLLANHLYQSFRLANQKHGAAVGSCLLHSSLPGAYAHFTSLSKLSKDVAEKQTNFLSQAGIR
jgi:hypothetical protein